MRLSAAMALSQYALCPKKAGSKKEQDILIHPTLSKMHTYLYNHVKTPGFSCSSPLGMEVV